MRRMGRKKAEQMKDNKEMETIRRKIRWRLRSLRKWVMRRKRWRWTTRMKRMQNRQGGRMGWTEMEKLKVVFFFQKQLSF